MLAMNLVLLSTSARLAALKSVGSVIGRPSRDSSPSAWSNSSSIGFSTAISSIWQRSALSLRSFLLKELDLFTARRTCIQSEPPPSPISLYAADDEGGAVS